jgi:2-polyprenyl-3-methyl-5-hydroxy-6-metoxy-1,4-benzoquinol methylase
VSHKIGVEGMGSSNRVKMRFMGNRDKFLLAESANKRVVHVGCTDWPFQKEQIKKNNFLHFALADVTDALLGVDVDTKGINELSSIKDVSSNYLSGDFTRDEGVYSGIVDFCPDIVLVPDVLEHIQNQKMFLDSLFRLQQETQSSILITTPNAFSIKTFLPLLISRDFTHLDHRLMHNEFTLEKVMIESGFQNLKISGCQRNIAKKYGITYEAFSKPINLFARTLPQFSDTLVVTSNVI